MAKHGTRKRYAKGCKCEECKRANAEEHQEWVEKQPPLPPGDPRHGLNGYTNYTCRCDFCSDAKSVANANRRATRIGASR